MARHILPLCLFTLLPLSLSAQEITSVHGTVSDELGGLMGATVCEIDANNRIINSTLTDLNGNFTMKVKNPRDKIRFTYVGMATQILPINKTTFNIHMRSATTIREVVVKSQKRAGGNNLPIPERELSYSSQTLNMKDFEGMGITTIDEALQGRIAGLDIVANSGDVGAGSTMRLRGVGSISTNVSSDPLIVVDGNVRNVGSVGDLQGVNLNQRFADILNINPEDIATINVLKDAAACAIYGSEGANGVIELTTKRGARGKPSVRYSLKLTAKHQPKGYDLLSGDDYTMMLKESYFNPRQDDQASDAARIPEINYLDDTGGFAEWRQYRDNTDWLDAVTQWGLTQNHNVTISGGGEKATFFISGGYTRSTYTVLEQLQNRFSTRVNLDYNVSERIHVKTNFDLTYTKNDQNSDGLMNIALKKMPNMSIYEKDPVTGENTSNYYTIPQLSQAEIDARGGTDVFANDQRGYVNPVASAYLAKNYHRTYSMGPELIIDYNLLGMDPDHWQLKYNGTVKLDVFNSYDDKFYPQELKRVDWEKKVNTSSAGSSKQVSLTTRHTLTLTPAFKNKDHILMAMGRFELRSSNNNSQSTSGYGLPSTNGAIISPSAGGLIDTPSSNYSQSRAMLYRFSSHYGYKGRYFVDFTLGADGTTKFGPGKRWNYFPSVGLNWIISDEPWMQWAKNGEKNTLSLFKVKANWGRNGNPPGQDYLYASKYVSSDRYIDMATMRPENIRLTDIRSEIGTEYNFGTTLEFFNHRLTLSLDVYHKTTSEMFLSPFRIPSNTGFKEIPYHNNGKLRNIGWEFYISSNEVVKAGKFAMDVNVNFGNNSNRLLELDEYILDQKNSTFDYKNGSTLKRVQLNNPFGAIYGFKYHGVYQYNYSTFKNAVAGMTEDEIYAYWDAFKAAGKTAPVAVNEEGRVILDANNVPKRMVYDYRSEDGVGHYPNFPGFNGGDAIYEDLNHDGQINALDITYLGSSLPKLYGGFGFSFRYADWHLSTQFTYRVGNKIINMARLNSEAMVNNDNQSQAVNYRWRKEGDVTTIPRAMFGSSSNYNTLISDRFVESGTYLRLGQMTLSYNIKKKYLTWIGLKGISLYATADNLFVLTKYSGVDPDIAPGGDSPAIDNAQTPRARTYTLSINVTF